MQRIICPRIKNRDSSIYRVGHCDERSILAPREVARTASGLQGLDQLLYRHAADGGRVGRCLSLKLSVNACRRRREINKDRDEAYQRNDLQPTLSKLHGNLRLTGRVDYDRAAGWRHVMAAPDAVPRSSAAADVRLWLNSAFLIANASSAPSALKSSFMTACYRGRQTSSRFSSQVTSRSRASAHTVSTTMPAITPLMSNRPSASRIR